ncbi:MAG: glycosyltransferase family 2 protein [Chloroflexia bacterium]
MTSLSHRHPEVSVIMAVYNGAQYVREAIDSILSQTFPAFEFIVVDDGSTDDTPRILATYSDPRVIVIPNESNRGLTRALNRGIRASRGKYIARQDADDTSFPERLERQVQFLESHPEVGLVGTGAQWVDAQGLPIQLWQPISDPVQIQEMLLSGIPFLHGTFVFRRACLEDTGGGYNEKMPVAQDCDLLLRIADRWHLTNLPDILYIHRRHEDTVTARQRSEQKRYERLAQITACQRRLAYGWARLRLVHRPVPSWVYSADRKWMAERYLWWSAGARAVSKGIALQFLLIALALNPTSTLAWAYIWGIIARKLQRLGPSARNIT